MMANDKRLDTSSNSALSGDKKERHFSKKMKERLWYHHGMAHMFGYSINGTHSELPEEDGSR
jgi:hypothetical protein